MAKQSLDEKFSRLRSPKNRRKKTPKWRKGGGRVFITDLARDALIPAAEYSIPVVWDTATDRPINTSFLIGWPLRELVRSIAMGRFVLAERNDL
jgi:hypothetical protein